MTCEFCDDTGIEPCDNCGGLEDHTCTIDGVDYGPSPCRRPWADHLGSHFDHE